MGGGNQKYLGTLAEALGDDGGGGGLPGRFGLVGHDAPPAHKGSSQKDAPPPRAGPAPPSLRTADLTLQQFLFYL